MLGSYAPSRLVDMASVVCLLLLYISSIEHSIPLLRGISYNRHLILNQHLVSHDV